MANPNHTPMRQLRVGTLWDDASELAALHGVTMTDLVKVALAEVIKREDLRALLADVPRRGRGSAAAGG